MPGRMCKPPKYSEASANYHHAAYESRDTSGGASQEADEAQARYQRNCEALDRARSAGQTAATVMRYVGIAILFAGLMGSAASMPPSDTSSPNDSAGANHH